MGPTDETPAPMTEPVTSPCTGVCRIDPATGLCAGCLRTLQEIIAWGGCSEDEKRAVIRALETRRATVSRGRAVS